MSRQACMMFMMLALLSPISDAHFPIFSPLESMAKSMASAITTFWLNHVTREGILRSVKEGHEHPSLDTPMTAQSPPKPDPEEFGRCTTGCASRSGISNMVNVHNRNQKMDPDNLADQHASRCIASCATKQIDRAIPPSANNDKRSGIEKCMTECGTAAAACADPRKEAAMCLTTCKLTMPSHDDTNQCPSITEALPSPAMDCQPTLPLLLSSIIPRELVVPRTMPPVEILLPRAGPRADW